MTIEQAAELTGKGIGTIHRLIRRLRVLDGGVHLTTETLPSGDTRVLISKKALTGEINLFAASNAKLNNIVEERIGPSPPLSPRADDKDKQIADLKREAKERDALIMELKALDQENQRLLEEIDAALLKYGVPEYLEAMRNKETIKPSEEGPGGSVHVEPSVTREMDEERRRTLAEPGNSIEPFRADSFNPSLSAG